MVNSLMGILAGAGFRARIGSVARSSDLVAIIEAAYAPAPDTPSWLRGVLEAFHASYLPEGCYGYTFQWDGDALDASGDVLVGLPDRYGDYVRAMMAVDDPDFIATMYACPPCATLSSLTASAGGRALFPEAPGAGALDDAMRREQIADQLGLRAEDGSGAGVLIGAPLSVVTRLDRAERDVLMRVLAHVAAGHRLHRRASHDRAEEPEAVLRPDGGVEHIEGVAAESRELLRDATVRRTRARGALRDEDPTRAVELWRALVDGRWSLVDHFDHGGRRYVVARRNSVHAAGPARLTPRQREIASLVALGHSNKLIAYELGLSESTVSSSLVTIRRKLGVSSRVALVRAIRERE